MDIQQPAASAVAPTVPKGVNILAILGYIGAVIEVLGGIAFLFGGTIFGSMMGGPAGLFGGMFVAGGGLMFILVGVVVFFIARGLHALKNWARMVTVVLLCLGILSSLVGMLRGGFFSNLIILLIEGWIAYYLWFTPEVRTAFGQTM